MQNAPDHAFLEEGAEKLMNYYGITPKEAALDAAEATWQSLVNLGKLVPRRWSDVECWLMHPQLQANIAYYKAAYLWDLRHQPVPEPVVENVPVPVVEKPLPEIIRLAEDAAYDTPTLVVQEPMLTSLLDAAASVVMRKEKQTYDALDELVEQLVTVARNMRLVRFDVRVRGVRDFSPPARVMVESWMKEVRLRHGCKGLFMHFKFDARSA